MNKKIILWIIVLICLLGTTMADLTGERINYYEFNQASGNLIDLEGNNDCFVFGEPFFGQTDQDGNPNEAIGMESIIVAGQRQGFECADGLDDGDNLFEFTISFWVKFNTTENSGNYIVAKRSAADKTFEVEDDSIGLTATFRDNNPTSYTLGRIGETDALTEWQHFAFVYSVANTSLTAYWNGTANGTIATAGLPLFDTTHNISIGSHFDSNQFNGTISKLQIWNRSLSAAEIYDVYGSVPPPPTNPINLTLVNPEDNGQYNTSIVEFNAYVNSTNDFNCTLYINGTLNETRSGWGAGSNIFVNFTKDMINGDYNHTISCTDGGNTTNSSVNTFFVDIINPIITYNLPANLNTTLVIGTLNTNISLSDTNLYSFYFNVTYPNGTLVHNKSNTSLTGLTTYTLNESFDMGNYSGYFLANMRSCDGHTKAEIDNMFVRKLDDLMEFDDIFVKSLTKTKDITYEKLTDKYTFEFKYDNAVNSINIEVPSTCKYLSNSGYKGHFVCEEENKWIDFEGDYTISVKDNIVTVSSFLPLKEWKFNSLGELNCNEESVKFLAINTSYSYKNQTLGGLSNDYNFNITYNSSFISSISASLWHNLTKYSLGLDNSIAGLYQYSTSFNAPHIDNANMSVIFEYFINGIGYNTSLYNVNNQSIELPKIDNCSTYSTNWINYSIRDELSNVYLNNADAEYSITYGSGTYSATYNGSESNTPIYDFCMYPEWANFTADISFSYSADDYDSREYITDDYYLDRFTDLKNLYMLSAGNSTDITVHVVDDLDKDIQNVLIEVYRYDAGTNTDYLVETETTDSGGNVLFQLKQNTEYYSFKFYRDGSLKLTTSRFKIVSTTLEYVLQEVQTTRLEEWLSLQSIDANISYDNVTNIVQFNWSDDNNYGDRFCLNVTNAGNLSSYYAYCLTDSVGSINFTITEMNISYVAQGIVRYTDTNNNYVLIAKSIDTRRGLADWLGSDNALMIGFILFLFISLLSLVNKNMAIVGGVTSLMMLYAFGIIPGFTTLMGIIMIAVIALFVMNKRYE